MTQATKLTSGRIAFIHGLWHTDIVLEAHGGFIDEAQTLDLAADAVDRFEAPGAYELPLLAQKLAKTGRYDAIVAAAFVVDGGIYRHDFVAQTVVGALMQVQLATEVPVFSVVLTPHHFHEHDIHQSFFHTHFRSKGAEAARAVSITLKTHALVDA
jgi:6,7-dimethyl-8-ribityllumazine synthase